MVIDGWYLQDHAEVLTGTQAVGLVQERLDGGKFDTWFEHQTGRLLAVVTNGARAMVMLLTGPGDAGEHAIDPAATGWQTGYRLSNGQDDTYDNRDTVPLGAAMAIVEHIIDHGQPPDGIPWQVDR